MKKSLIELLMKVPKAIMAATVQNVPMQMIDNDTWMQMLQGGLPGIRCSKCSLFLFSIRNNRLNTLYKVQGAPVNRMSPTFENQ